MADRTCPDCGSELQVLGEFKPERPLDGEVHAGRVRLATRCPNPDCPGNESDLAPAANSDGA